MTEVTGLLTQPAREALEINAAGAYEALVPERPHAPARVILERVARDGVLVAAKNRAMDRAAVAGLWLWHDFLDESHTISQSLETPEGSYWHAIMHRREGDFSNSKYWLRRVGKHDVFAAIAALASEVDQRAGKPAVLQAALAGGWEPFAFVDLVQEVHTLPNDPRYRAAVELQRIEWQALFDHCVRLARG